MLAGVVAAPSDYSPFSNLELARDRAAPRARPHGRERIHHAPPRPMPPTTAPLGLIAQRATGLQGYRYPYFTTYAIAQLERIFGKNAVEEGGLQVYTTLDPRMQQIAQEAVTWGVRQRRRRGNRRAPGGARRAASVDGRDPGDGRRNRSSRCTTSSIARGRRAGNRARRSRSYVYTAAIDTGMPASTIDRRHAGQLSDGRRHALVAAWTTTTATWARSRCAKR